MARHLAICERKSAYPSRSEAKSAIVTHSMLDVLGLVRKPEEGPSGMKKKSITAKRDSVVADESKDMSNSNELDKGQEAKKLGGPKVAKKDKEEENTSDTEIEEIIDDTDKSAKKTDDKEKDALEVNNEELNETVISKQNENAEESEKEDEDHETSSKSKKANTEKIVTINVNSDEESDKPDEEEIVMVSPTVDEINEKSDEEKPDEEDEIETAVSSEAEDTGKQDEEEVAVSTAKEVVEKPHDEEIAKTVTLAAEEEPEKPDKEEIAAADNFKPEDESKKEDEEEQQAVNLKAEENTDTDVTNNLVKEKVTESKNDQIDEDEATTKKYIEVADQSLEAEKLAQNAVDIEPISSHIDEEASATYEKEAEVPKESAAVREQISPVNEMETSEVVQEKTSLESDITSDDIQNLISDVVGEKSRPNINFDEESASMETETDIPAFSAGEDPQGLSSRQMEDVAMQISQDESMEVPDSNEVMDCEVVSPMETD